MTLEEIKNMTEDEFIELIKKYLPNYKINKIYNNKPCKDDKRTYSAVIITLGILMGIIPIGIIEDLFNKKVPLSYTTITLTITLLLSYIICNKSRKKEYIKTKEEFNNRILNLKDNITNLSNEEFNILSECYYYIENNELPNEVIDNDKILRITEELLSINATNILREFESKEDINDYKNNYNDISIGYSKTMNKND